MPNFTCNFCGISKDTSRLLNVHIRLYHTKDNNYVRCYFCFRSIRSCKLEPHIGWHTKEQPYKCHFKCIAYNLKSSLKKHYKNHHPGFTLRSKPTSSLNCYFCGRRNKTPFFLENHLRVAHTFEKPYKCEFSTCPRTFPTSGHKRKHVVYNCAQNVHRRQKLLVKTTCYFCLVNLSSRHIYLHMNGHTGEQPFKCLHCGLRFSQPKVLKRHILSKHKIPFHHKCSFCGVSRVTVGELNTHIRRHHTKDNKKFKCYFCDKEFPHLVPNNHMVKHTNEFHHKCKYCPAQFRALKSLKYHYFRNHPELMDGSKIKSQFTFSCRICGEKFYTMPLLLTHVRNHQRGSKYAGMEEKNKKRYRVAEIHEIIDKIYKCFKIKQNNHLNVLQ